MNSRHRKVRRAFTLVEAIATMVVLSTVGLASTGVMWAAVDAHSEGSEHARLHAELSIAMERVVREIRSLPPDADDKPDIAQINSDSVTYGTGPTVISLQGDELWLSSGGVDRVLLDGVTAFTLAAFDADNGSLSLPRTGTDCDGIRRISIELSASGNVVSETIRTKVFLRCMALEAEQ